MDDVAPMTTRRGLLAGGSVGVTGALAGCWERLWSQAENSSPDQVSLTIKTVPTDDDELAPLIAGRLRENYRAAGIDATLEPITEAEFYRDVLLEGDYDVFVARHPGFDEYDALYGLLHSRFFSEPGWQNPFHFAGVPTADDLLERQRSTEGDDREDVLVDLVEYLLETTPYTVVAHPYAISGVHDRLEGVPNPPRHSHDYFEILSHSENDRRDGPLEVGVFGEGLAERLNPLIVDRNRIDGLLDLLYDPLARRIDDAYVPWLAEAVEWDDATGLRADVTLREGVEWHDGEPLDTDDVAFTLEFLGDTSMGEVEDGVPAPRFRGRQTLVETTEVIDSRTITLFFRETARSAAKRALTVPVLPEHIWADRSTVVAERQTEALVDDNPDPVGSGLFVLDEATSNVEVVLEPFDDHVLRDTLDRPSVLDGFSRFDGLRFQIEPNPGALVDALVDGEIDITASELPPESAGEIREAADVSTITGASDAFYMIGYNAQHTELAHPSFRRVCSQLIDREHLVDEFFEGFAEPAVTPNALVGIRDDEWEYDDAFDDRTEPALLEFPGTDGEIDPGRARSLFREIHYNYEGDALLGSRS